MRREVETPWWWEMASGAALVVVWFLAYSWIG